MKKIILSVLFGIVIILALFGIKKIIPVLKTADVIKYDINGNEIYIKNSGTVNTIYQKFNDKNQLIELTNINENKEEIQHIYYEYADDHLIKRIHKGEGLPENENYEVKYEYNDQGLIIKESDSSKGITEYKYDEKSNLISEILPDNKTINYEYDENGKVIKEEKSDGSIKEYEYDEKGRKLKEINKNDAFWGNKTIRWEYFDDDPKISRKVYKEDEIASSYMIYNKNDELIETCLYDSAGGYTIKYKKIVLYTHWKNGNVKTRRVYTLRQKLESMEK